MHCVTNIHEDLYWLGGSDRQLAKFENVFPIPRGVSYNAYLVLASATYNGEIYTPMENFLRDLACHGLRGRSVALIENGTWAARSGMLMTKLLEEMKEMRVMEGTVTLKSSVKEAQRRGLESLADAIADELLH